MNKVDLFVSLGDICNLQCSYCNRHSGGVFLPKDIFQKLISQFSYKGAYQISYLSIWGGEPLLHPDFDSFIETIISNFLTYDCGVTVSINTNGLLINKKIDILERLVSLLPNNHIKLYISLDGLTNHENSLRGLSTIQNSNILSNIELLHKLSSTYKNLKISTSSVLSLQEVNLEKFKSFVDYFTNKGIGMGFCFQAYGGKKMIFHQNIGKSLLERCKYITMKKHKYVIEGINNMNKTLRCNEEGNIYNFIDDKFIRDQSFQISRNGNLDFLKNTGWEKYISEDVLYLIIYRNPDYIRLLKYLNT